MRLADKVALITGGSRGIGRAIALRFAHEGADVAFNYQSDDAAAAEVVGLVEALGRRALARQADVAASAALDALVAEALATFGRIDVLVCNAGTGHRPEAVETTDADWDRVMAVNARGVFAAARAALPSMMERRGGRVITISSIIGKTGRGYFATSTYAASKGAVIAFTRGIAREAAPFGITANCICPGWIDTARNQSPERLAVRERALQDIPLGRLGCPDDIAATALFLASDEAGYITGQTIDVNGGLLMD
jgi:3-oxoacyl-[acyl-carrier protein] reductase